MGFKTCSRSLHIVLFLLLLAALSTAQTGYKLEGTVINSVTAKPVVRALVQIGEPVQQSALTGADGTFHFDGVPPGKMVLKAQKPGFLGSDLKKELWSQSIEIGPKTGAVRVQLVPEIVIEGRVEIEGDDPLPDPHALYRVLRTRMERGRKVWETAASGEANADGQFRVSNLPPGGYYVGVEANWSSRADSQFNYSRIEDEIFRPPVPGVVMSGVPVVYRTVSPPVFYPGEPDPASASLFTFTPEKREPLVLWVKRPKLYKVSGTVSGGPGFVHVDVLDEFGQRCSTDPRVDPDSRYYPGGKFVATLPAGKYIFRASQLAPRAAAPMFKEPGLVAEVAVTVNSDISDLQMRLLPAITISVIVRAEFTGKTSAATPYANFQWVTAGLYPLDAHHQDTWFKKFLDTAQADPPKILNVVPGRYALEAIPNSEGIYIHSARSGQVDLLREELVAPAGGQVPPLEIVVRDDGGVVTGNLKGTAGHSSKLVIVPQFAPMQPPAIVSVDEHGNFHSPALAPGEYKVFGFDSLENVEYANREILDRYGAVRVKVLPHASMNVLVQANKALEEKSSAIAGSGK